MIDEPNPRHGNRSPAQLDGDDASVTEQGNESFSARPSAGTCYGFEVVSSLDFEYLRGGSGSPLLVAEAGASTRPVVGELVKSWSAIPGKRSLTRVYRDDGTLSVQIGESHWFQVEADVPRITVWPTSQPRRREMMLWTTPAALGVVGRGDLALHAAVVEVDGKGLLFTAPSGSGKTTMAAAFLSAGYRVLSEDFGCCRLGEQPVVLPGPALVRVSREAASRLDLSQLYVADEDKRKVHFALDHAARGDGTPVPLSDIVFLRRGDCEAELSRAAPADALRDLWAMSFHSPERGYGARCFHKLADLVGRVPAWNLSRKLDWVSLPKVVERAAALVRTS